MSLRAKLLGALVGVTTAALVLSGAVTFGLVRRSASDATIAELRRQADAIATGIPELVGVARQIRRRPAANQERGAQTASLPPRRRRGTNAPPGTGADAATTSLPTDTSTPAPEALPAEAQDRVGRVVQMLIRSLIDLEEAGFYELSAAGEVGAPVFPRLPAPAEVTPDMLDGERLLAGDVQTGTVNPDGRRYAWVARSLELVDTKAALVLVAPVDTSNLPGGRALVVAGVVALVAAAGVSLLLARRLTRPVRELQSAATGLQAGDYSRRVPVESEDEIGALGGAFNEMAAELERSRRAERDFLMSVSHDLRTPLTSIKGYAEAIADGAAHNGDAVRAADVIGTEAGRLERLVRDLLDLARLDAREFKLHLEEVDLDAELADLADAFAVRAQEAGIDFRVDRGLLPAAATDPDRVAQVVSNLLENSLRYVPGGRSIRLSWRETAPGWVDLTVADTGNGIAPDDLPHVFQRLYVASRYRGERPVGTGLGLAIVADLTAALGGRVSVRSQKGAGTTFLVQLPLRLGRPQTPGSEARTSL